MTMPSKIDSKRSLNTLEEWEEQAQRAAREVSEKLRRHDELGLKRNPDLREYVEPVDHNAIVQRLAATYLRLWRKAGFIDL